MVVFELRIDNLNILLVLPQQVSEILEAHLNALGQTSHGLALCGRDPSIDALCGKEHFTSKVITAHSLRVCHRVNLTEHLDDLTALLCELLSVYHDATTTLFSHLYLVELLIKLDRICNEAARICLDQH